MDGGASWLGIIGVGDACVDTGVVGRQCELEIAENGGELVIPMVGTAAESI